MWHFIFSKHLFICWCLLVLRRRLVFFSFQHRLEMIGVLIDFTGVAVDRALGMNLGLPFEKSRRRLRAMVRDFPTRAETEPGPRILMAAVFSAWWQFQPTSYQPSLFIFRATDSTAVQRLSLEWHWNQIPSLPIPFCLEKMYKIVGEDDLWKREEDHSELGRSDYVLFSFLFPLWDSTTFLPFFPWYHHTSV